MKKKIIACVLTFALAGTVYGCGGKSSSGQSADLSQADSDFSLAVSAESQDTAESAVEMTDADEFSTDSSLSDTPLSEDASDQRKEYVIYCPDETLPDIFVACYPGYEQVSEPTDEEDGVRLAEGKIGDMQIHWVITDYLMDDENASHLDELLVGQQVEGASEYDWVDLFVVDEINIEKYIGDGVNVALNLHNLGITDGQMRQQLPYTRELASDGRKQLGASIDVSPGVFLYRRSVANAVLGTDDPVTVSEAVQDWESFKATAEKTGEAGYKMLAGYDAAFDVYSQSVENDWQSEDGSIHIDDHLMEWVETTDAFVKGGICGDAEIASDAWSESLTGKGDVFGYFLSAEEIGYLKEAIDEENTDSYGDWGIVPGPAGWYRGGTWLCAAVGTPNPAFGAEIIRNLTCDEQVMKDIYDKTGITVNNKKVLLGNVEPESVDRDVSVSENESDLAEVTDSADVSVSESESDLAEITDSADVSLSESESNLSEIADLSESVPSDESVSETAKKGLDLFSLGDTVGDAFCDPFFGGQQTGPVYVDAAKVVANPVADWERWKLDDMFEEAYYPYFRGECSLNDSLASFYQNAKNMLIITEDEEW